MGTVLAVPGQSWRTQVMCEEEEELPCHAPENHLLLVEEF
jgi:hypothetical protein